jgi:3-phenylpropionate/cinnamic acid dioxygenase small subunit
MELDAWKFGKWLQYLIQQTRYDDPSWEFAESINKPCVNNLFHEYYPDKPGTLPE